MGKDDNLFRATRLAYEALNKKLPKNNQFVERSCDVCSDLFFQRRDSNIAGKNGQFEKVFLCPKHRGYTR